MSRPDEDEDKFDHDPDATGWQREIVNQPIDTKAVLADLKDDVEWMRDPIIPKRHWYAETIIHLWDALAQEITDREALEKLLEEGRAILSNHSIIKIQGNLVGQVVFGSWSERVNAALAAKQPKPPTPKPIAPEPQILIGDWADRFDAKGKP